MTLEFVFTICPVMIWFLEDYRDDVVLVVRVQHFELSDPAG